MMSFRQLGGLLVITGASLLIVLTCNPSASPDPTDADVAKMQSVQYDGHPTYWFGGHWVYKDDVTHAWRRYSQEPAELHQRWQADQVSQRHQHHD